MAVIFLARLLDHEVLWKNIHMEVDALGCLNNANFEEKKK
jgi:hypothetical protein